MLYYRIKIFILRLHNWVYVILPSDARKDNILESPLKTPVIVQTTKRIMNCLDGQLLQLRNNKMSLVWKLKGGDHLGELGIDGGECLKWAL
jgi:hypothetical protein